MQCTLIRRFAAAAPRWSETQAGHLCGVQAGTRSPGLVWLHGLGGSCAVDDARGIGEVLNPSVLSRTVLRLDLRGHGLSSSAHVVEAGVEQYLWSELAKDVRIASRAALSRAYFGGEAIGAAVALHAAVKAAASNSMDTPPGLVLMRPSVALVESLGVRAPLGDNVACDLDSWRARLEAAADAADAGGLAALRSFESSEGPVLDYGPPFYAAPADKAAAEALVASAVWEAQEQLAGCGSLAPALRGTSMSKGPSTADVEALQRERQTMAAEAYGVPLQLKCPTLILAMPGDAGHSVAAAEALASLLPGSELVVAAGPEEAHKEWATRIAAFLKKAWMKEFLSKRVMPQ